MLIMCHRLIRIFFSLFSFKVSIGDAKICLLNTHLESTKEGAALRIQQLNFMLRHMKEIDPQVTILAGGDLNLRDKEVGLLLF